MAIDPTLDWVGSPRGVPSIVALTGSCFEPGAPRDTVGAVVAQIRAAAELLTAPAGTRRDASAPLMAKLCWERLYERTGAACFVAAALATPEEARSCIVSVLEAWSATPFVAAAPEYRCLWGHLPRLEPFPGRSQAVCAQHLVKRVTWRGSTCTVSVLDRGGEREVAGLDGFVAESETSGAALRTTQAQLAAFVERLRAEGPPAYDPRVAALVERETGIPAAAAALLWSACLETVGNVRVDVQPHVRKQLGLRVKDVVAVEPVLRTLHAPRRPSKMLQWFNVSESVMPYQAFFDLYEELVADPNELFAPLGRDEDDPTSLAARFARACASRPWLRA